MPRRTPRSGVVTKYLTRNLPVTLLQRVRARAAVLNINLEEAFNLVVEAGLDALTRPANGRPGHK